MWRRLRSPLAALALFASACGHGGAAAPGEGEAPPDGAVLRVDGRWVYADEVDAWLDTIAILEPEETLPSLRRKALTNIVLPRAVAAALDPRAREAAERDARRALGPLLEGEALDPAGPQIERLGGHWRGDFGMDVWGLARGTQKGVWSDVYETVGGFTVFRVLEAPPPEEWDVNTRVTLERVFFPYLPPESPFSLLQQAVDVAEIEVVDPAWEELLPAHYKYSRRTFR